MSCVTLEYYPTDEYKSDSDFRLFWEQNSKPFIESKSFQMFSTEKELKILISKMVEYGMILNVTKSKAKFIIQMAGRPLIPLKSDHLDKVKAFHCHILNWRDLLEQFALKT